MSFIGSVRPSHGVRPEKALAPAGAPVSAPDSAPVSAPAPVSARRRRIGRAASIAGSIIFGATMIAAVVFRPSTLGTLDFSRYAIAGTQLPKISLAGFTSYTFVAGHSMEPTLWTGDLAIVVKQDASAYKVGDIVSFHPSAAPKGEIIHRIVGGDAVNGFVTRGDNRATADFDRPKGVELVGKAVVTLPKAALVLQAIRQPLVIASLAALFAMFWAWDFMTKREEKAASAKAGSEAGRGPKAEGDSTQDDNR